MTNCSLIYQLVSWKFFNIYHEKSFSPFFSIFWSLCTCLLKQIFTLKYRLFLNAWTICHGLWALGYTVMHYYKQLNYLIYKFQWTKSQSHAIFSLHSSRTINVIIYVDNIQPNLSNQLKFASSRYESGSLCHVNNIFQPTGTEYTHTHSLPEVDVTWRSRKWWDSLLSHHNDTIFCKRSLLTIIICCKTSLLNVWFNSIKIVFINY